MSHLPGTLVVWRWSGGREQLALVTHCEVIPSEYYTLLMIGGGSAAGIPPEWIRVLTSDERTLLEVVAENPRGIFAGGGDTARAAIALEAMGALEVEEFGDAPQHERWWVRPSEDLRVLLAHARREYPATRHTLDRPKSE